MLERTMSTVPFHTNTATPWPWTLVIPVFGAFADTTAVQEYNRRNHTALSTEDLDVLYPVKWPDNIDDAMTLLHNMRCQEAGDAFERIAKLESGRST